MTTDFVAEEAQRSRWARWLTANALDDPSQAGFGKGGVGERAESLGTRFVVLPSDPESAAIELDKEFWDWIAATDRKPPPFMNRELKWGYEDCPTASGGARVDKDGRRAVLWRRWLMVYRSGALEFGLPFRERTAERQRQFLLLPTVGRIWAALDLHRELIEARSISGPFLAVLGMCDTRGSRLGGFGEGWQESEFLGAESHCGDPSLMFRQQFQSWPDAAEAKAVALRFGNWIEDAFGSKRRRFSGIRYGRAVDFDGEAFE